MWNILEQDTTLCLTRICKPNLSDNSFLCEIFWNKTLHEVSCQSVLVLKVLSSVFIMTIDQGWTL